MSELERQRERMMENEADDLPFGKKREPDSTRNWFVLLVGVVLAAAVPLMYLGLGLGGAAVSGPGAWVFIAMAIGLFLLFAAVAWTIYARTARTSGARRVPRDDFGNRVGLSSTERDALASGHDYQRQSQQKGDFMKVSQIMRANPVVCGYLDSVHDCARDMYKHNVGYLVVLDANDQCIGVVTDRDLVCGAVAQGVDIKSTPVTTVMERSFQYVSPNEPLENCLKVMQRQGVRRVPVIEAGKCVGVVSIDDLIMSGKVSIEDVAMIYRSQLSEPGELTGLSPEAKNADRAA